jgi:acyl-CoA thioesterase I
MKKILFICLVFVLVSSCSKKVPQIEDEQTSTSKNLSWTIIALWDSLTAWYGLSENQAYPHQLEQILKQNNYDYRVINSGVSWNTSSDLKERLSWVLDDTNLPSVAILVIGWNDGLRSSPLPVLKENIESMIDSLQSKNIKVVLWWMQIPPNLWITYSNDFKKLYSEIAEEKKVFLIPFFLEWVATKRNLNLPDMIHPNEEGYKVIAQNVYQFLISENVIPWLQ